MLIERKVINMSDVYKTFSLEDCADWNKRFDKATHDNNKKEIMSLLSEANHLYFDEYFIYNTISKLNSDNINLDKKEELINNFNKSKIVKFVIKQDDYISINTRANCIKIDKLSDIIKEILKNH